MLIALAPRVAARRQVRAEPRQVVARRAEVVEHRVDQHAEPAGVAGVDEPHQPVGAAVGLVHRVPQHAVVTPAVGAAERVDRHQLDEVDAEVDEVVELVDRRVEGAVGGERADVQFVDHRALDRSGRASRRRSTRRGRGPTAASARARRRAGAATEDRAAPCRVVVEHEAVAGVGRGVDGRRATSRRPTAVIGCTRAVDVEAHPLGHRCPHREFVVSHRVRSSSATGRSANRSAAGDLARRTARPVSRSVQVAVGQRATPCRPSRFRRAGRSTG